MQAKHFPFPKTSRIASKTFLLKQIAMQAKLFPFYREIALQPKHFPSSKTNPAVIWQNLTTTFQISSTTLISFSLREVTGKQTRTND